MTSFLQGPLPQTHLCQSLPTESEGAGPKPQLIAWLTFTWACAQDRCLRWRGWTLYPETWAEIQVFHSLYTQQGVRHLAPLNFSVLVHEWKGRPSRTLWRWHVIDDIHCVAPLLERSGWHPRNGGYCCHDRGTGELTRTLERGHIREYKNTEQWNVGR